MKILIIIDSLGAGGAEKSTAVLSDYLYKQNIYFEIICLNHAKEGVQDELLAKGYPIQFLEPGNFIIQAKRISTIIRNGTFDIVHSILFRSNLRTRLAKLFGNFLHIESLVNTTYSEERIKDKRVNQPVLKLYKYIDSKSASKGVDHFHSITETVKKHYVEEIGLNPSKITVIPRGRKPIIKNFRDRPEENKTIQFVNVGRHEFQKGQIHLLEAAKILKEQGYDFNLNIYGRDGSTTPQLKQYILTNNLQNHVNLAGFKSNISEKLITADVFVFSSLYEGLGGAMIEAQAAGLPIACNTIPVFREVVNENINAKFFESHKPSTIAQTLEFFIKNPEVRISYGERSLQNFQEKFLEEKNNERMLNLYQELAS